MKLWIDMGICNNMSIDRCMDKHGYAWTWMKMSLVECRCECRFVHEHIDVNKCGSRDVQV